MSQFDWRGRLSVNHTAKDDFRLVISQVRQTDSGICSVDDGNENQHVTVVVGVYKLLLIDLIE